MARMRSGLTVALVAGAVMAGGASTAAADAGAQGWAAHSPGVGSGNLVQVPVHVPVDACGDAVGVVGLLNPAFGTTCVNA
ncbi:chaplin [Streptomyces sp. NRRL F-5727]|uniref:chaplin n=1 Tax=Streptomyces sp. NRRL F-5727 TaxID=1463871 RepID=UPI00099C36DE|nr:chaplin [Streptomyces sp. NRRL F-5727]